jgi:hypothetical protein
MIRPRAIAFALSIAGVCCTREEIEVPRAPVAFAGFDGFAIAGETVALDASLSFDPDGDLLSYSWKLQSSPLGSAARIDSAREQLTSIVPDLPGTYVASLTVSDGVLQARDLVAFTATSSTSAAPRPELVLEPRSTNRALADGRAAITALGARSGDVLETTWLRVPAGAAPEELALDVTGQEISFLPSRPGEYWISAQLRSAELLSAPAIATVAVFDDRLTRPRAELDGPAVAAINARVLLDGRNSQGAGAAWTWTLIADPSGGRDALVDLATGCPTGMCRLLLPSAAGLYVVSLEVEAGGVSGVRAVHAIEVHR